MILAMCSGENAGQNRPDLGLGLVRKFAVLHTRNEILQCPGGHLSQAQLSECWQQVVVKHSLIAILRALRQQRHFSVQVRSPYKGLEVGCGAEMETGLVER